MLMLGLVGAAVMGSREARASGIEGCPEIIQAYFGERSAQACSVAWCESRWDFDAISPTDDYGVFQINRRYHGANASLDPDTNVAYAYRLSKGGMDWGPWSCKP